MNDRPRIVFAGTPEFAVPALDALAVAGYSVVAAYTQPDRPSGRGQVVRASPVKQRALELGIAIEQPATLRTEDAVDRLAAHRPDLMVVVAYGLILPPPILSLPRLGCWNIHASLLPRWRGAAPIQRAILAGDATTGITIMQMEAGLDTGPMLLVRSTPIGARETGADLHDRLAALGAEAIVAAVAAAESAPLVPIVQPAEGVTHAAKIRKDEALIDWRQPAQAIDRLVRAFNPWPIAETRWRGRQLRIWEARPEPAADAAEPGVVIDAAAGRLRVATGDGVLSIGRLQVEGRRQVSAAEFLRAHPLAGERLGA